MTGILGLALPPWLSPTFLGAVGIALVAGTGGAYIDHKFEVAAVTNAKLETAGVQSAYDAYKGTVAANAAKATADALAQQTALQASNNALQAQLQDQQRISDAKSQSLRALLASAKPGDVRPIGPTASSYYDRLRQQ